MSEVAVWLDGQSDRLLEHQRSTVDTAKLLSTFAAAIAATLTASALEVEPNGWTDIATTAALAAVFLLTLGVGLLDRLTTPDHVSVMTKSVYRGWDEERKVNELRVAAFTAVESNETTVRLVKSCLALQLLATTLVSVMASISLLG